MAFLFFFFFYFFYLFVVGLFAESMFDGSIASESILGLVVLFIFFSSFVAVALVLRKALEMLSFNIVSSSARLFADLI